MWTNHNSLNHSPIGGHDDCLSSFAIVNNPVYFQNVINLDLGKAGLAHGENSAIAEPTNVLAVLRGLTPMTHQL